MHPIFQLTKGLEIPSFFLVISIVLSIGLVWLPSRAKIYHLPQKNVLDLSLILMLACLLGARLFHVIYENPEHYLAAPEKVLYLWEGGFVYYGGAILGVIAALGYLRFKRVASYGTYFDTFSPVLAFMYGAGRIGCFLAGCCYGRSCDAPWAIAGKHPAQLYATFWELGVMLILLGFERNRLNKSPGGLFVLWIALHSLGRLLMESFRDDFRGGLIFSMSISTFISWILLIGSTVALSLQFFKNRKSSP
ncbi:MAG: prolipoprotein diacylglyceryl transferase [Bdellovibrionaceae bacterium]|nr:prolipoprotein diacylglyceryl transferase [Pseudobdellovibrionaceae bacterium]